ncbi:MAG: hypothetical protein COC09_04400 [Gammaproteobacteria bacterium]|nr:hypothetical protein [Gammaproteobacteria bacterium]PCH63936.1 MAG: hypothetical protein COC09_04400 [Gammaproteobacteria bacterium]
MRNRTSLLLATSTLLLSAATLAGGISFQELDINADGLIDQGESAKSPVLAPLFSQADNNADGSLDQNEFSVLVNSTQSPGQDASTEEAE